MQIDQLADWVNRKLHFAKVLLEQWQKQKELTVQQDTQWADFLLSAQVRAFEESVSYFLVFGFQALVHELLESCGAKTEFHQALGQSVWVDPTDNKKFLSALVVVRKNSPELSQLALWAQDESSLLNRLLVHYSSYGITALERKKVEVEKMIPLQEAGLSYDDFVALHAQLMQITAQFREQMQEF